MSAEDQEASLKRAEAALKARRKKRDEEEEADIIEAQRLARAHQVESDRLARRRREDEAIRERREAEDREAERLEAEKAKRAATMTKSEGKKRQVDDDEEDAGGRGRGSTAVRAPRGRMGRGGARDSGAAREASPRSRRPAMYSPVGMTRHRSFASSVEEPEESVVTVQSRKRSTEGSKRETSRSGSRGGMKRARKMDPLVSGVKCVRCAALGIACVPVKGRGKTCEVCREKKVRCDNPPLAGTDGAWIERARERGEDPGPSDRVYGPVSSPARGFEDADDYLWGKWLDIDSRIHLQVVEAIDRTNRHLADQTEVLREATNASMLTAIFGFHAERERQSVAGNTGFFERVRTDYRALTGLDLGEDGEHLFSGEPAESEAAPVPGRGRSEDVENSAADAAMEVEPERSGAKTPEDKSSSG